MEQKQRLLQKQVQKMLFSPRMQESMHILQMPLMELKTLIENELETNPLLEEANHETAPININREIGENDIRRDMRLTKPLTLQEHLLRQLTIQSTSFEDMQIGEELIGNIDDDGYLKASFEEIAQAVGEEVIKIEAMAAVIQSFEPLGVCARDLKECLLIQLEAKGKKDSLAWNIVENHLSECGKKQYMKIAKALGTSLDEVKKAVSEISKLEPKPGRRFSNGSDNQCIVPDIYVKKIDDEYHIATNQTNVPNIRISALYKNVLSDKNSDKDTKSYIRDKLQSANFIIKCIRQRWETIQRLTEFIVKEQGESLEKGRSFLKPLTFKTAAKAIGRHESTISRAIANKYMDTPSGIYELREFFNGKIARAPEEPAQDQAPDQAQGDNGDHSTVSVKIELKSLIDKEPKQKPLSDQKLQKILTDMGIRISRRTIAKYRDELKILPSHLRKV